MRNMEGIKRTEINEATMERDSMRVRDSMTASVDNVVAADFESDDLSFDNGVKKTNVTSDDEVFAVDFESDDFNFDNCTKDQLIQMKEELLNFEDCRKIDTPEEIDDYEDCRKHSF